MTPAPDPGYLAKPRKAATQTKRGSFGCVDARQLGGPIRLGRQVGDYPGSDDFFRHFSRRRTTCGVVAEEQLFSMPHSQNPLPRLTNSTV
jgi:hypothetical protein